MIGRELISKQCAFCASDATVDQVALLMIAHDCRAIAVIDLMERPVGIVTDRDIIRRIVAEGKNPLAYPIEHCMSRPVVTVSADDTSARIIGTMRAHQVQRVLVVDDEGRCLGIISEPELTGERT